MHWEQIVSNCINLTNSKQFWYQSKISRKLCGLRLLTDYKIKTAKSHLSKLHFTETTETTEGTTQQQFTVVSCVITQEFACVTLDIIQKTCI